MHIRIAGQTVDIKCVARATTEQPGYGVVGVPLLREVQRLIPGTTGYTVQFKSDFSANSPAEGSADAIRHINSKTKACPQQKYVLSGYSQGAVVVHMAADKLDKSILRNNIIATATFGDPGQLATKAKPGVSPGGSVPAWPDELQGKIKFNCNNGDPTCTAGGNSFAKHATYMNGAWVPDSAKFIHETFLKSQKGT